MTRRQAVRDAAKWIAHALSWLVVTPSILSWAIRGAIIGRDRALEGSTQLYSLLPGLTGQYLRRAFLTRALRSCARSATIEFGTVFSSTAATIGPRAYVGPGCHLGWVNIEADALLAAGVHIPSGAHTHGIDDPSKPIREQPTRKTPVRVGAGSWIGSNAIVLADVGSEAVVGAGAVVTRPVPSHTVAGGVPARVLRDRHHPLKSRTA